MKKRLLITSALMTAVLGASLATGTYAWYAASANGTLQATDSETINASVKGTYEAVNVALDMSFGTLGTVALTDTNGDSWVLVNGTKVEAAENDSDNGVFAKYAQGTLTWGWNTNTPVEQKAAFAGKTYTVTVAATGATAARVRLHDSSEDNMYSATETISVEFSVGLTAPYNLSVTSLDFWYSVAGLETLETEDVSVQLVATMAEKVAQQG